jgi:small subunit ribosomal protein S8
MPMLSTDPIADMLTRIRNAIAVGKTEVRLPHSKLKATIAQRLVETGYLADVKTTDAKPQSELIITINDDGKNARITEIQRMSKPGRRLYVSADDVPRIKNGRGLALVSTSKGILTDDEARKAHMGGELICKIY